MEVSLWITIVSDIVCAIIGGVFGVLGKTISQKNKEKRVLKQKAGDHANQLQIGGNNNGRQD